MGRPATKRAARARRKPGSKQARGRHVDVNVQLIDGEPHAIVDANLAAELERRFAGAGSTEAAHETLRVEPTMNPAQDADNLLSAADRELVQEADNVELPGDDAPGAAPGEGAPGEGAGPSIDGEVTDEQAREAAARHRPMMQLVVNGVADGLFPNWNITLEERDGLSESFSLALGYWWPTGTVPPKWAALAGVLVCGYSIANARRNPDGTWQPRKIVTVHRAPPAGESAAAAAASEASPGGGFSTSA